MPEPWNNAVICSIFKKSYKTLCNNYRGYFARCGMLDPCQNGTEYTRGI